MAKLGYGLLAIEEVSDDALAVWIVADVLWRAPAGYDQSRVVGWIHIGKGDVGVPTVARLFGVGIEARLKIVYDEMQLLLCWSCDVNLVSLFLQSLIGIHHFQRLCSIAGENENFGSGHGVPPLLIVPYFRAQDVARGKANSKVTKETSEVTKMD